MNDIPVIIDFHFNIGLFHSWLNMMVYFCSINVCSIVFCIIGILAFFSEVVSRKGTEFDRIGAHIDCQDVSDNLPSKLAMWNCAILLVQMSSYSFYKETAGVIVVYIVDTL